jgi:Flp pilus assembly protein TadG
LSGMIRTIRGHRGVTIVEFALVLPLLLVLIFSIIDFGLYFFVEHTLQFATREGVRLALVGRTLDDPNGNPLSREASIIKMINDHAALAVNPSALEISIYPVNPDYTDPTDWKITQDAGGPGSYMRVKTRYYYKFITPLVGALLPNGRILVQSQATYKNELF